MKRLLSLLAAAALLLGLTGAALAGETTFTDQVEAQAFAVAMAYHEGGFRDDVTPRDPDFLWEATGWYAAWLYRTQHIDLMDEAAVLDFQSSFGVRDGGQMSVEWLENAHGVRLLRRSDGSISYDFAVQKARIDELLGQTMEFLLTAPEPPEAVVTLREHYALNAVAERHYVLRFMRNRSAGSAFPYSLRSAAPADSGPVMDPALDFDWDGLVAANSLKNILSLCDCVKIQNNVDGIMPIWIFRRGGSLAILRTGEDYVEGEYRGCWFFCEPDGDGKLRPRIAGFDPECGDDAARDDYISNYVSGAAIVDLDCVDGDLIRTSVHYAGDWSEDVAVDRGTLLLRETSSRIDGETDPIVLTFSYGETPPAAVWLDSWNGPLRHVTLVWEDFEDGAPRVRRETVEIPADWEYIPWEGRWGDYTIYMNEEYTRLYAYPGDGTDYTLWLTTAKG